MDTSQTFISISIGILYPFFFNKLASVILNNPSSEDTSTTKFILLMVAGVVGIIGSGYFPSRATALGLALGGFLTILTAVFMNWDKMNDAMKLGITGASLALLIYVSINGWKQWFP
jgi:hypothetical protein